MKASEGFEHETVVVTVQCPGSESRWERRYEPFGERQSEVGGICKSRQSVYFFFAYVVNPACVSITIERRGIKTQT